MAGWTFSGRFDLSAMAMADIAALSAALATVEDLAARGLVEFAIRDEARLRPPRSDRGIRRMAEPCRYQPQRAAVLAALDPAAWASVAEIARTTGFAENSVGVHVRALAADGCAERGQRPIEPWVHGPRTAVVWRASSSGLDGCRPAPHEGPDAQKETVMGDGTTVGLDSSTRRDVVEDVRNRTSSATEYTDAEIGLLADYVADHFHGLFLAVQQRLGVDDGGFASIFFSGDREVGEVANVVATVLALDWDGSSLPRPWDGTATSELGESADDLAEEEALRAARGFCERVAGPSRVDEDAFGRAVEGRLSTLMLQYAEEERAMAAGPRP